MSQPPERRCAVCGKAQVQAFRPFCSKRCADLDLARWLGGGYAIPAVEADEGLPDAPDDAD
ncbi:MAG TPA: DNA gyrase inhibitor YacG [Rhizomicrobium sp.]|nr:DNA gyrase inhibitor YacG [Rhizomicrobium sp.]